MSALDSAVGGLCALDLVSFDKGAGTVTIYAGLWDALVKGQTKLLEGIVEQEKQSRRRGGSPGAEPSEPEAAMPFESYIETLETAPKKRKAKAILVTAPSPDGPVLMRIHSPRKVEGPMQVSDDGFNWRAPGA